MITADTNSVSVSAKATYNDKNAGTGKAVTYSNISLSGAKKDNYVIVDTMTGTNEIKPKTLTATFSNISRAYNGTKNATENGKSLNGVINGDTVSFASGITGTFADKNVGTNKTVTYSGIALTGTDKANYTITSTATGKGTISKANLTLTAEDVTKTYDGTTAVTGGTLKVKSGTLYTAQGDSMSGGTFAFTDKNAGTGKTVTVTGATISDGNSGNNYNVTYADNTTSTINKAELTATFDAISKTYDGTTADTQASRTATNVSGVVTGETVGVTGTATYTTESADDENSQTVS